MIRSPGENTKESSPALPCRVEPSSVLKGVVAAQAEQGVRARAAPELIGAPRAQQEVVARIGVEFEARPVDLDAAQELAKLTARQG